MEPLHAVEYIRRMRGGSQSHLIRASDDRYYVIKVQNNPQGVRVLTNEMLGSNLARLLGLPVPLVAVVDVDEELVRQSEEMVVYLEYGSEACQSGLCCGSEFNGHGFAFFPNFLSSEDVENPTDILGMLVFDKWTSNSDRRQWVFYREKPRELHRIMMIDQGDCFCRDKWTFLDDVIVGLSDCRRFYGEVTALQDFEPWLDRLENDVTVSAMRKIGSQIPPPWYRRDRAALDDLIVRLDRRRMMVRGLLRSMLQIKRDYFPRVLVNHVDHAA